MSNRLSFPLHSLIVATTLALGGCQGGLPSSTFQPFETASVAPGATYVPTALPGGVVVAGRVIATGGGNFIGTNTGGVISTGGGNVISTGGGNFRVLQATGVVVKLKLDTGKELSTTADVEGRFHFEIVPAAGETLAGAGELTLEGNGTAIVVSYPTGGEARTSWIRFQTGLVFDLGDVTVEGETTRVERNPLAQVDSDGDGQVDAEDLDDDNDATPDATDGGSAVYDKFKQEQAAEHASPAATTQGAVKNEPMPGKGNGVKDVIKETGKGAKPVVDGVTDTVGETTGAVGDTVDTVTDTVGNVVDTVTGNEADEEDDRNDSPVETVVDTVTDTVDTVTEKLPKLPKLGL